MTNWDRLQSSLLILQKFKVNKSVYVALSGQQHEITINIFFFHVLNQALNRFVIKFSINFFNKNNLFKSNDEAKTWY